MDQSLFEIQPESCRQPLPLKEIEFNEWYKEKHSKKIPVINRVMFYDPTELYLKIHHKINPYKRHQSLGMEALFPKTEKYCACGCGKLAQASTLFKEDGITPTWQRKWHNDECAKFASDVLSIINNYFGVAAAYITRYYGNKCAKCPNTHGLELDHIVGVKHGGGGSWLSNYEWKCKDCHRLKTNTDFGFKGNINPNQIKIDI